MQRAPEKKQTRKQANVEGSEDRAQVFSLAAARVRRARRCGAASKPLPPELTGLDLRGVDLERMTPSAREHYWFSLNRYARLLYANASEMSSTEEGKPYAPVTAEHVRGAELRQVSRARRIEQNHIGLSFVLDALQILGAALCGALATKPDLVGDAGVLPLAVALAGTVSIFLAREILSARAS